MDGVARCVLPLEERDRLLHPSMRSSAFGGLAYFPKGSLRDRMNMLLVNSKKTVHPEQVAQFYRAARRRAP